MRTKTTSSAILLLAGIATAQDTPIHLGAAGSIVLNMRADKPGDPAITPAGPIVASLTYDGTSSHGFFGQDFESIYDIYDTWVCETIALDQDSTLTQFRSVGFATGNAFAATDLQVDIWPADLDICSDGKDDPPIMESVPGAGFWDGAAGVTDFGGQCLPAGEYTIGWRIELEFACCGMVFFYAQAGPHDHGGGEENDGFQRNLCPGCGFGNCFSTIDGGTGLPTGINFILLGEPGGCDACPDPDNCGDIDGDGDSDADDFFLYIDMFASNDPCADIDEDADIDAEDFFAYLDRFVNPC